MVTAMKSNPLSGHLVSVSAKTEQSASEAVQKRGSSKSRKFPSKFSDLPSLSDARAARHRAARHVDARHCDPLAFNAPLPDVAASPHESGSTRETPDTMIFKVSVADPKLQSRLQRAKHALSTGSSWEEAARGTGMSKDQLKRYIVEESGAYQLTPKAENAIAGHKPAVTTLLKALDAALKQPRFHRLSLRDAAKLVGGVNHTTVANYVEGDEKLGYRLNERARQILRAVPPAEPEANAELAVQTQDYRALRA